MLHRCPAPWVMNVLVMVKNISQCFSCCLWWGKEKCLCYCGCCSSTFQLPLPCIPCRLLVLLMPSSLLPPHPCKRGHVSRACTGTQQYRSKENIYQYCPRQQNNVHKVCRYQQLLKSHDRRGRTWQPKVKAIGPRNESEAFPCLIHTCLRRPSSHTVQYSKRRY